jgi:quinoprotein relay system zinc metallohydrolase 2
MIELVLSLCLLADPNICAQRLLPARTPVTRTACLASASQRAENWAAARLELALTGWECKTPDLEPASATEIAPGLWVHKGLNEIPSPQNAGDLANTGFIVGADMVAVIDAGGSRRAAEQLYLAIRQVTDLPLGWLILTHMHPDHVMGASLFADAGADLLGHAAFPDALANRAETYGTNFGGLIGTREMIATRVVAPDKTISAKTVIDLGGRLLTITPQPTAHTNNDLMIRDELTGTLWLSDLVFAQHLPALDGSIRGWLEVLDALARHAATRLVPGHGPVALEWPAGLAPTRDYLAALAAQTREAIDRGESLRDAIKHVGQSLRGDWQLFDEFNARNATAAYTELEWE